MQAPDTAQHASNPKEMLPDQQPQPSILARVPGGEGLHAGGCGCRSCVGEGVSYAPDFVHVREGEPEEDAEASDERPPASPMPQMDGGEGTLNVEGKHPGFPNVYAQTYYSESDLPSTPSMKVELSNNYWPGQKEFDATVASVTESSASFPTLCTPAGTYECPSAPTNPEYTYELTVGAAAASKIAACEDEHVQDLQHAWMITHRSYCNAVNMVALGDPVNVDSLREAREVLGGQVAAQAGPMGALEKDSIIDGGNVGVEYYMNKAYKASKRMRDGSGSHTLDQVIDKTDDNEGKVYGHVSSEAKSPGPEPGAVVSSIFD